MSRTSRPSESVARARCKRFDRIAAAVFLCVSSAARRGRADEGDTVRLAYVRGAGAEACPDEGVLRARVTAQLGRDPFRRDAERSVDALLERRAGRFRFAFVVRDGDGPAVAEREFDDASASCDAIANASAFAVALAIDPGAALRARPAGVSATVAVVHTPVPPRRRPGARVSVLGRALGALGVLPRPAAGVGLVGEVRAAPQVVLGLALSAYAPVPLGTAGPLFDAWFASLLSCLEPVGAARWELGLCAGFDLGVLSGQDMTVRAVRWFAAPSLGARFAVRPVTPLRLELGVRSLAPVVRNRFETSAATELFTQPIVAAEGYLSAGVDFR